MNTPPRFIALGHHGLRRPSAEGRTWGDAALGDRNHQLRAGCFAHDRYIAVGRWGGKGIATTSSDGHTWDEVTVFEDKQSTKLNAVAHGNGLVLAVGGDGINVGSANLVVVRSHDGRQFDTREPERGQCLNSVCFGNDRFVMAGDRGLVLVTRDGEELNEAPDRRALDTFIAVAAGSGRFVGVGLHGLRMTSEDGLAWSAPQTGREGEHLNSVLWVDDRFVAVGLGATYFSPDGLRWERHENTNAPFGVVYSQGTFVGCNWRGRLLASTDAITWQEVEVSEHHIEGVLAR